MACDALGAFRRIAASCRMAVERVAGRTLKTERPFATAAGSHLHARRTAQPSLVSTGIGVTLDARDCAGARFIFNGSGGAEGPHGLLATA